MKSTGVRLTWFDCKSGFLIANDRGSQRVLFPYNRKRSQRKVLSPHISVLGDYENYGLWAILWLEVDQWNVKLSLNRISPRSKWQHFRSLQYLGLLLLQAGLILQNFTFAFSAYILNIFPIQAHPVSLFVYPLNIYCFGSKDSRTGQRLP